MIMARAVKSAHLGTLTLSTVRTFLAMIMAFKREIKGFFGTKNGALTFYREVVADVGVVDFPCWVIQVLHCTIGVRCF